MKTFPTVPLEQDPSPGDRGVLLSDRIEYYVKRYGIIDPFCEESLEPAGYQMRVGKVYYHGCNRIELRESEFIEIRPYDVVIIETAERICVPRFMIARWNIKVKLAYRGLLWVGAAQVDPGYVGHLACPIYNLSRETVRLRRDDKLALIDFVKTTPYDKGRSKAFQSSPTRGIDDVARSKDGDRVGIESALSQYEERVGDLEKRVQEAERRSTQFTTLIITLLGILFAVLMGVEAIKSIQKFELWVGALAVALSLAFSLTALVRSFTRKRGWWSCTVLILLVAVISFLFGSVLHMR